MEQEEQEEQEPVLIQYIKDRIHNKNKNFLMLFVGPTGSGKSYAALRQAEMLDKGFNIDRVCFKAIEFMNTINNLVERAEKGEVIKGRVVVWDEFGVEHSAREFMTISNRVINYFFQTSRHLNLVVIMTVPLLSFIDSATRKLCHGIAEMKGINSHDKIARVRIKLLQTNVMTGKEYPKYLRYKRGHKMRVNKMMMFHLPSKELREAYELKKKAFTTQLNKDIMGKLLKSEAKNNQPNKAMTDTQQRVAELLDKHCIEKVAEILNITPSCVYVHKVNIEKKGYVFQPVWKDKRIICYKLEGFKPKENGNTADAHV